MRRFYSKFPGGLPGLGLLLLRLGVGVRFMVEGAVVVNSQGPQLGLGSKVLVLLLGGFFVCGLFTSAAGTLATVVGIAVHLWFPNDPALVSLLSFDVIVMATALSLLGPGAFSLDAHFFGRRKIIIPRMPAVLL